MDVAVRRRGAVTVVDLSGKITVGAACTTLQARVDELAGENTRILLNLENVPYMDSAGLGSLMHCHKSATHSGADIKLLNPAKRVYDLLHSVKLNQVFDIFADEEKAIIAFSGDENAPRDGQ